MGDAWVEFAVCRGMATDMFFPARGADTRAAKAVCADCPVSAQCLRYALENHEHLGIWGGTTDRDRRRLRRELGIPRKDATRCGTTGGYRAHRERGEEPCDACRWAQQDKVREWRLRSGVTA